MDLFAISGLEEHCDQLPGVAVSTNGVLVNTEA